MWAPGLEEWTHLCELYRKRYPRCAGVLYRLWQCGPSLRWLNTYMNHALINSIWSLCEVHLKELIVLKCLPDSVESEVFSWGIWKCWWLILYLFYRCTYITLLKYSKYLKYDFSNSPCYQALCTKDRQNGCLVHKWRFWKNSASSVRI